ncbi:MAG: hypothetical protein Q9187_002583 [Circinaria calcarea]
MAAVHSETLGGKVNESGSRALSISLPGEELSEMSQPSAATSVEGSSPPKTIESSEQDLKSSRRKFWAFGKKKEEAKPLKKEGVTPNGAASVAVPPSPVQLPAVQNATSSPGHPLTAPSSPGRNIHSPSPRMSSPASSQIFERNVQEDGLHTAASPAVPAHITTENHIPPVLDASTVAITDDHLNPDNVEIVMHTAHQPAAVTVTGTGISEAAGHAWQDDLIAHPDNDEAASNYGALDANDVRRLSFISFADVVHAEHVDHSLNRDSIHLSGQPSALSLGQGARSPSPVHSPISSQAVGGSPAISASPSLRGLDSSPSRAGRLPGSPRTTHSPPMGGELTIETMRQALRKTGSGDLSGARSQPMSAMGGDDGTPEPFFK